MAEEIELGDIARDDLTGFDVYKIDHRRQYPAHTTRVYSNWTPRESRIPGINHVIHFGLQYFLDKYLGRPVWRDGSFLIRENFADIRNRVLMAR